MSNPHREVTKDQVKEPSRQGAYLVLFVLLTGWIGVFTIGDVVLGWNLEVTIPKVLILGVAEIFFSVMLIADKIPVRTIRLEQIGGFLLFLATLSLFIF